MDLPQLFPILVALFLFSVVSTSVVERLWVGVVGVSQNIHGVRGCTVLYTKKMLVCGEIV